MHLILHSLWNPSCPMTPKDFAFMAPMLVPEKCQAGVDVAHTSRAVKFRTIIRVLKCRIMNLGPLNLESCSQDHQMQNHRTPN